MKILIVLLLCIATTVVQAQKIPLSSLGIVVSLVRQLVTSESRTSTVSVKAYGVNDEDARKNGFVLATQYAVGETILSERNITSSNVRDTTIQYSSGFVSNFKINDRYQEGDKVVVLMDVQVKQLRLHDRLTTFPTNQQHFDGEVVHAQITTASTQQGNGTRLLDQVLADFPKQAVSVSYNVNVVKNNNNYIIAVPTKLKWNKEYITALDQAIKLTDEGGSWYGYDVNGHNIQSYEKYNRIRTTFVYFNLNVAFYDGDNNLVMRHCQPFNHQLVTFQKNKLSFNQGREEIVDVNISIKDVNAIKKSRRVNVEPVAHCQRNLI